MVKYCPTCGTQTDENDKFCLKCGANLQIKEPIYQESYGQPERYISPQPKKSYTKIIGAIFGLIVVVIVLMILFLFVFKGEGDTALDDQFLGTWQVTSMRMDDIDNPVGSMSITFNSDGTYTSDTSGVISIGEWEIKNNKLYLTDLESDTSSFGDISLDYSFSGDNTLILTYSGFIPDEDDQYHTLRIVLVEGEYSNGDENGNGETSNLIGAWNYEYDDFGSVEIIINSDHSLEIGYSGITYEIGTWYLDNGDICLTTTEDIFETGSVETLQCFSYYFSNGDTILTLTASGLEDIILTK